MDATTQKAHAATFRALHAEGLLILPNACDAGSARIIEACGAKAIATSSATLSWVHGFADGEQLPFDVLLGAVGEIVRVVSVPVSVDFEAGYGDTPEAVETAVRRLLELGVVGINLEDGAGTPEQAAAKIEAAKRAASAVGVNLFVNGRTDVYLHALGPKEKRLEMSLERLSRYRDAGCDGVFVPGLVDENEIAAIVREAQRPLNLMAMPGLPKPARLAELGVRRLSLGSALGKAAFGATRRLCRQVLEQGEWGTLFDEGIPYPEMNALLRRPPA